MLKSVIVAGLVAMGAADLRMASQPKHDWKVQQRNRDVPFQQKFSLYMEPSAFGYDGLEKQRDGGGYDNFLRSNIDNEQDRRNFNTEAGKDHLPFRSYETAANDNSPSVLHKMVPAALEATGTTEAGNYIFAVAGEPQVVPLRWNNPHSAELEVNIWVMNKGAQKYVIPVAKPVCSGEGYQDNVFTFTVPTNFNDVASCRQVGDCVLQIYAHSVESRMYSMGTPLVVEGGTGAWAPGTIKEPEKDLAWDLAKLRRLCLPRSDANANHLKAVVYKARLSSDVYNHAYQNSDFSPYAGQQPQHISQNMQASRILKMAVGNFGELGKQYMQKTAPEARQYAGKLDKKARGLIRVYETTTNSIIAALMDDVANSDTLQSVDFPDDIVTCGLWKDQYDRKAGGRERGVDRHGGYCTTGLTCLCHQDCYLGYGPGDNSGDDAYCAKLVNKTDKNGAVTALQEVEAGSEAPRMGMAAQKTEMCFRCAEAGSTVKRRHNTNTYIPSFEISGADNVEKALNYVAPIYLKSGFLTDPETGEISVKGDTRAILQIYMAVLTEMYPELKMAADGSYMKEYYKNKYDKLADPKIGDGSANDKLTPYVFTYRGPVYKTTTATLSDANGGTDQEFRKLDAAGAEDKGYYSAKKAWPLQNRETGSSTPPVKLTDSSKAGPIDGEKIEIETNMAEYTPPLTGATVVVPKSSGGDTLLVKLPPNPQPSTSCSAVRAKLANLVVTTEEGDDMDGLNYDADCDDDENIRLTNQAHDNTCLQMSETNASYVCPPYPEPVCHIPGIDKPNAAQMFTNNEAYQQQGVNGASALLPTTALVLAIVTMLA